MAHGEVGEAVRRQSLELIAYGLEKGFKVASFTNSLRSFHVPAHATFSHVLLELSRNSEELFEPTAGLQIALNPDGNASAFPWNPQELSVISWLQVPQTFDKLLTAGGFKEQSLKKILGILERVGVIETRTVPAAAASESQAPLAKGELSLELLVPAVTNAMLDEKLEAARNEFSFASEQFRNLKIQLRQAESDTPLKVFTVSSPDSQDGKSLISMNLAFSFAQDPGLPSTHHRLRPSETDIGQVSWRNRGTRSSAILCRRVRPLLPQCFLRRCNNLHFLTAGGTASNPIEVLSMRKMKELIEKSQDKL